MWVLSITFVKIDDFDNADFNASLGVDIVKYAAKYPKIVISWFSILVMYLL